MLKTILSEQTDDPFAEPVHTDEERLLWWRNVAAHTSSNSRMLRSRSERINKALRDKYNIKDATPICSPFEQSTNPSFYTEVSDGVMVLNTLIQHQSDPLVTMGIKVQQKRVSTAKQYERLNKKINGLESQITKQKRQAHIAAAPSLKNSAPSVTVDPAKIPLRIVVPGRSLKGFENPWHDPHGTDKFAGSPFDAPLHSTQIALLAQIQKALLDNGIKPLTRIYFSKHRVRNASLANFFAFNSDLSVVWRKTQTSQYNGINVLYLKGTEVETSMFCGWSDSKKAQELDAIKP